MSETVRKLYHAVDDAERMERYCDERWPEDVDPVHAAKVYAALAGIREAIRIYEAI